MNRIGMWVLRWLLSWCVGTVESVQRLEITPATRYLVIRSRGRVFSDMARQRCRESLASVMPSGVQVVFADEIDLLKVDVTSSESGTADDSRPTEKTERSQEA